MGFGSVKVLCKSKVTVIVCCGVSKVTQQLPFSYQSVVKWLGTIGTERQKWDASGQMALN